MKKILFVVAGYPGIGMGHVFRVYDLAKKLSGYKILILCTKKSLNAFNFLQQFNDNEIILQNDSMSILDYIKNISPNIVINDILNTSKVYIESIINLGIRVINFEDIGEGAMYADLTINAIYSYGSGKKCLYGHEYFDLRDEFINSDRAVIRKKVKKILLTFGGEDQNNLSLKFLKILESSLSELNFEIITGPAYSYNLELSNYIKLSGVNIAWSKNVVNMHNHMLSADLVISSNGRTTYELAALGIPSIIISANEREMTHTFAGSAGFINLGLHTHVSDLDFIKAVKTLMPYKKRLNIHNDLLRLNLTEGKNKIINEILAVIESGKQGKAILKEPLIYF